MFCRNCGTKLSDTAVFCSNCGTRVAGGEAPVSRVKFSNPDMINSDPGRAAREAQLRAEAEAKAAREAEAAREAQLRAEAEARAAREAEAAREAQMKAEAEARAAREAEAAREAQMKAEAEARAAREAEAAKEAQMRAEAEAKAATESAEVCANPEETANSAYITEYAPEQTEENGANLYDNKFEEYQDSGIESSPGIPEYSEGYPSVEPQPQYDRAEDYKIMDWNNTRPGYSPEMYAPVKPNGSGLNVIKSLNSAIIMIIVVLMTFAWFRIAPANSEDAIRFFGNEDGSVGVNLSQLGSMTDVENYIIQNVTSGDGVKTAFTLISIVNYSFIAILILYALSVILMFAKHKISSIIGIIADVGVIGLTVGSLIGVSIANDTIKSLVDEIKVSASPVLYVVLAFGVLSIVGLVVLLRKNND